MFCWYNNAYKALIAILSAALLASCGAIGDAGSVKEASVLICTQN